LSKIIHILIVEDNPGDARLIVEQIKEADYEPICEILNNKEDIIEALKRKKWDIILSDFNLPGFNAFDVLEIVEKLNIDIPFIVLTGVLAEERAIGLMHSGADDFIKKDNLSRLVPAIERELKQVTVKMDRKKRRRNLKNRKNYLAQFSNRMSILYR